VKPPRILLAKLGLDGHDRGVIVVAMALRDAGAEVIYLGQRRTSTQILEAASAEDVDVIGISILSGSHLPLIRMMMDLERELALGIPIVVGGTIPDEDAVTMREWGVHSVYPVGIPLDELVTRVVRVAGGELGVSP